MSKLAAEVRLPPQQRVQGLLLRDWESLFTQGTHSLFPSVEPVHGGTTLTIGAACELLAASGLCSRKYTFGLYIR